MPPYTGDQFRDDLMRLTEGLSDPDMADILIQRSRPTVVWMRGHGVRWILMIGAPVVPRGRQAPLLGRAQRRGGRRRAGADPGPVRGRGAAGRRGALRDEGARGSSWTRAARIRGVDLPRRGRLLRGPDAARWSSPRAGSRRIPSGARAISAPAGSWPTCAARATTPGDGIRDGARGRRPALRQLVGLPRGGVGRGLAALRRPPGRRHVPEALVPARDHRQRPRASASWTRAPTSGTTRTRSTGARSCGSPAAWPSRSSTRRSCRSCARSTGSAR